MEKHKEQEEKQEQQEINPYGHISFEEFAHDLSREVYDQMKRNDRLHAHSITRMHETFG